MINYLFSSIDKENGFTEEQSKFLKYDIPSDSNITFIASVFDNFEENKNRTPLELIRELDFSLFKKRRCLYIAPV